MIELETTSTMVIQVDSLPTTRWSASSLGTLSLLEVVIPITSRI
jgi:hypothetical protein